MSTVVYSNGVMAADTRAYSGNGHPIGNKMKIRRLTDGSLVGVTTNVVGFSEAFMAYMETKDDNDLPGCEFAFDALHVKPDGRVFLYCDSLSPAGPLIGEHFTIGSGRKYALGALTSGLDSVRAVEVAAQLDQFSGLPVAALPLHERAPELSVPASEPVALDQWRDGTNCTVIQGGTIATTEDALAYLAAEDA
ncbi:hypothetical protein [Agrobacterium sp. CG674]